MGILDNSGALVVEYKYDAWGNPLSVSGSLKTSLSKLNPSRYRGYVYDEETELYYLRSRYYNPIVAKFVNANISIGCISQILSHNLYAYCMCSPILYVDRSGYGVVLNAFKDFWTTYTEASIQSARTNYKLSISLASNVGLSAKNYPLANKLFSNFLWGNGKTLDDATKNEMSIALSLSDTFAKKIISDYAQQGNSINSSIVFSSGDLHYAIGKASYTAEVTRSGNLLHVTGVLSDTYDFTEERTHDDEQFSWLSVGANNLGFRLQRDGYGIEYTYSVPFEMDIPIN